MEKWTHLLKIAEQFIKIFKNYVKKHLKCFKLKIKKFKTFKSI